MSGKKEKSVLDNVPVDDRTWPLNKKAELDKLGIVGHCPKCGCPIYGKPVIEAEQLGCAEVRRTCSCVASSLAEMNGQVRHT